MSALQSSASPSSPIRPIRAAASCMRSSSADALTELGHDAVLHAPDPGGRGLLPPDAAAAPCRCPPRRSGADVTEMVETRVADYVRHFESPANRALRRLPRAGRHFRQCAGDAEGARADPRLRAHRAPHRRLPRSAPASAATRSITAADRHFVVSRTVAGRLAREFGLDGDRRRQRRDSGAISRPSPMRRDALLRQRLDLCRRPAFSRRRRRRGAQEHASACSKRFRRVRARSSGRAPRHRRRRIAARPRRLSRRIRRRLRGERPAARGRAPRPARSRRPTCPRSTAAPTRWPSPR